MELSTAEMVKILVAKLKEELQLPPDPVRARQRLIEAHIIDPETNDFDARYFPNTLRMQHDRKNSTGNEEKTK